MIDFDNFAILVTKFVVFVPKLPNFLYYQPASLARVGDIVRPNALLDMKQVIHVVIFY